MGHPKGLFLGTIEFLKAAFNQQSKRQKVMWVLLVVLLIYFMLKSMALFFVGLKVEQALSKLYPAAEFNIGRLSYSILGRSVSVHRVSITDNKTPIIHLNYARVSVELFPLLQEKLVIQDVRLSYPELTFSKKGGKHNFMAFEVDKKRKTASNLKKKTAKKTKSNLALVIKRISVDHFKVSYVEAFEKETFTYSIDNGNITARNIHYPFNPKNKSQLFLTMQFPQTALASLKGELSGTKRGEPYFTGNLSLNEASVVSLKGFMQNHYDLVPTQGSLFLTSNITVNGTKFETSHDLQVKDLSVTGDTNVVGIIVGSVGNVLAKYLSVMQGDTFQLKFNLNGDLAGGKLDGVSMIGKAVSQAFFSSITVGERSPAGQIKEATDKALKMIEGIIP